MRWVLLALVLLLLWGAKLAIEVGFQTCDPNQCLPPTTVKPTVALRMAPR